MKQHYMVTVVTRFAVEADDVVDAVRRVKNEGEGREVDVHFGTVVKVIDPDMVHIYAGVEPTS